MKLSWKWIFEIYGISPSSEHWKRVDEVQTLLPLAGIEIASVKKLGDSLDDIVIAKVLEIQKHPQADRLNVCKVNDGKQTLQVVCGASNVRAGLTVALAPVGAKLPGGLEIKAAKIRGVDSFGMICSDSELGLAAESKGILELPDALVVGQKFLDAIEVRDAIWEVELTPDRSDCLSIVGLAREMRRYFGKKSSEWPQARSPERDMIENEGRGDVPVVRVEVQAPEACPIYGAQLFEGFSEKAHYSRLVADRLKAIGTERFHNSVVDLANYVLFELGHPMHTFDADQIVGSKIIVRYAKNGEKITTIDGVERTLSAEDLIIADIEKPIALAGVMGSKDSGVTEKSSRVVLESAFFDPEVVRATARRHKIVSDAAHRFERGVNPQGVYEAAGRLSQLFRTQLGAKKRGSFVLLKAEKADKLFEKKIINLDLRKVEKTLGFDVGAEEAAEALRATGIESIPKTSNVLKVDIPPYRWDLGREIDLVEEIARVCGFDKIPVRYPTQKQSFQGVASEVFERWQTLRASALAQGYVEIIPYAFVSDREREIFSPKATLQSLENPISEDWRHLRATLLPGILRNLSRHGSLKQRRVEVFETGTAFEIDSTPKPSLAEQVLHTRESLHVGWGTMGHREEAHWMQDKSSKTRDAYRDYFDAKGFAEAILATQAKLDGRWRNIEWKSLQALPAAEKEKIPSWIPMNILHPGRSALIYCPALKGCRGYVGELHPAHLQELMNFPAGWKFPVAFGELRIFEDLWSWKEASALQTLLGQPPRIGVEAPVPTPVVERDISLKVPLTVEHDQIVKVIQKSSKLLQELSCIDVFPLEDKECSLTFRLLLQAPDRTLQDAEVQQEMTTVMKDLEKIGISSR